MRPGFLPSPQAPAFFAFRQRFLLPEFQVRGDGWPDRRRFPLSLPALPEVSVFHTYYKINESELTKTGGKAKRQAKAYLKLNESACDFLTHKTKMPNKTKSL